MNLFLPRFVLCQFFLLDQICDNFMFRYKNILVVYKTKLKITLISVLFSIEHSAIHTNIPVTLLTVITCFSLGLNTTEITFNNSWFFRLFKEQFMVIFTCFSLINNGTPNKNIHCVSTRLTTFYKIIFTIGKIFHII